MSKGLITLGKIGIDEVFQRYVIKNRKILNWTKGKHSAKIRTNSDRYILFKTKGLTCVNCGKTANKAYVEITQENLRLGTTAHINFYYVDQSGNRLLFTKDHIIPKSKGGKDCQENYQTMCQICNSMKGSN